MESIPPFLLRRFFSVGGRHILYTKGVAYICLLAVIVETICQPISEQYIDKRNGQIRDKISTENMTTESAFGK
jgi:hypothetical protein